MNNPKLPIYRYMFKNNFGNDFDTIGISEVHENRILKITKVDETVTETTGVDSFVKELLIEPEVS